MTLAGCHFAPPYDPEVNAKFAEIKVNALDLAENKCMAITDADVHDRLKLPALTIQAMTQYLTRSSEVNRAASDLLKEIISFETLTKKHPPSPVYCQDKMHDIALSVDAMLKPYGTLP